METNVATAHQAIELLEGIMKPASEGGLLLFSGNQVFFNPINQHTHIAYMYVLGHWGLIAIAEDCLSLGCDFKAWAATFFYPATPQDIATVNAILSNG